MKLRTFLPLAAAASLTFAGAANAATITFDEYAANNSNTPITTLYSSLGVVFGNDNAGTWGGLGNGDPGNWGLFGTNGSAFLGNNGTTNGNSYVTTISFTNTVTNLSFDISRSNGSSAGQTLAANVYLGSTLVGTQSITFGAVNNWTSVNFGAGSYDKLVLTGSAAGFSPYGIDNLQIAAVPEAETYAMLLAGLGLMGSIIRRRKSSAA
jgi:outer membrane lipoprotein SlyB